MFVIGKSKEPRCFNGVRNLPCRYRAQAKSWMDNFLFEEWGKELDKRFVREDRKVALIIDQCQTPTRIEGLNAVELIFLPPNTTSKTQPMDQRVIRSVKAIYRKKIIQRIIREVNAGKGIPKISMLDAMQLLQSAWSEIKETAVQNCFRKAGISERAAEEAHGDRDDQFKDVTAEDDIELDEAIEGLRTKLPEEVPLQYDAAALIDFDEEIATSGDSPTDADILASARGELPPDEEEKDDIEVEEEPPACPASFEVDKAITTLQQLALFCDNGIEMQEMVEKVNMLTKKEFSIRKKQSTITNYFKQF